MPELSTFRQTHMSVGSAKINQMKASSGETQRSKYVYYQPRVASIKKQERLEEKKETYERTLRTKNFPLSLGTPVRNSYYRRVQFEKYVNKSNK